MHGQYSMRSPAVKRLMKEAQELKDPTELYHAQPLEDNLFEWHFTLRGPEDSDFDGGIYHGRIILPPEYPMKPPSIILLTPNGRFEVFKKICLSISGHHPESWQPSWSIRTALLAIIGFMPTHGGGAIGSLDYTPEERKVLAKKSQDWKCPECGDVSQKLKPKTEASEKAAKEAKELATQINFQGEKSGGAQAKSNEDSITTTSSTISTSSDQPTPAANPAPPPTQSPFLYPWGIHPSQQNPGASGSLAFPRFPYPPPLMLPPPAVLMSPPSNIYGQRLPGFPPMPFFQPGMRGFPPSQGAGGAVTEGALPQTVSATPVSSSQMSQSGSCPNKTTSPSATTTSSSITSEPAPTSTATTAETSSKTSSQVSTKTTETVTHSASNTDTTSAATDAPPTSTSASPSGGTTMTTASTNMTPVSSTELRQRTTSTQPRTSSGAPATSTGPTPQTQWSYSQGTVLMMVILSLAITLLLGRRIYLQYFGRDSRGYFH